MELLSEESIEHNSIIKQKPEFALHTGTEDIRVIKEELIEADDFIDECIDIKADLVKVEDLLEIKKELDVEIKQECTLEKTVPKLGSSARKEKMAERIHKDIEYVEELSRQFNEKEKTRRMKHFMRDTFKTSHQACKKRKRETKRMKDARMLRMALETEEAAEVRRARVAKRMRELRMVRIASETEEEAAERKAKVTERMKELRMIRMAFETEEEKRARKAKVAQERRDERFVREVLKDELEKETGSCSDNIVWFSKPQNGVTAKQTEKMRQSEDALQIDENYEMQASLPWDRQKES